MCTTVSRQDHSTSPAGAAHEVYATALSNDHICMTELLSTFVIKSTLEYECCGTLKRPGAFRSRAWGGGNTPPPFSGAVSRGHHDQPVAVLRGLVLSRYGP